MNSELKNKLHLVKMLYIVEEKGIEHDYHIMPFEVLCDRVHISNFEDAWKHYLEIEPNIVMIHVVSDYAFCNVLINKIKQRDPKCTFLVLATETLKGTMPDPISTKNGRLLFEPIKFEEMEAAIMEIVNSMNITYLMDHEISYEPHNSSLIYSDKHIELTTKENKLLSYLIENNNRIVSYDEIENYVWNDMYMNRNTLTSIISNIRKKAGKANFIKNYSNQGYKVVTQDVLIK
ncbi:winged helix-turn-helix domain-containing protein [bacterium]|nr:winged helix-turn-helix domain-containing protein [bacterium]MBU1884141.1 winged helix-turn-helix domain-containing protein [bacterium]